MIRLIIILSLLTSFLLSCGQDRDFLHVKQSGDPVIVSGNHGIKKMASCPRCKVDILWVIDNSGSMGSHHKNLIANTDQFIDEFSKNTELDWKMGILSTDISQPPFLGFPKRGDRGVFGRRHPDPITTYQRAIKALGTNGAYIEKSFDPIILHLEKHPHFLRRDSTAVMIFLSDEVEQSKVAPVKFLSYLKQLKPDQRQIKLFGVFATKEFNDCANESTSFNFKGGRFEHVIKATEGYIISLCSHDFGTKLSQLGKDIVAQVLSPKILLNQRPIISSIKVEYLGRELQGGPKETGGLWYYDPNINALLFYSLEFAPEETESIKVTYQVDDGWDRNH